MDLNPAVQVDVCFWNIWNKCLIEELEITKVCIVMCCFLCTLGLNILLT